jgi:hypothetical protein
LDRNRRILQLQQQLQRQQQEQQQQMSQLSQMQSPSGLLSPTRGGDNGGCGGGGSMFSPSALLSPLSQENGGAATQSSSSQAALHSGNGSSLVTKVEDSDLDTLQRFLSTLVSKGKGGFEFWLSAKGIRVYMLVVVSKKKNHGRLSYKHLNTLASSLCLTFYFCRL